MVCCTLGELHLQTVTIDLSSCLALDFFDHSPINHVSCHPVSVLMNVGSKYGCPPAYELASHRILCPIDPVKGVQYAMVGFIYCYSRPTTGGSSVPPQSLR